MSLNLSPGNREAQLFARTLKEEGIGEIYLNPEQLKEKKIRSERPKIVAEPESSQSGEAPPKSGKEELLQFREEVLQCTMCAELAATRKTVVFGAGNVKAALMFVGEAPGHDEDVQGLPFVGKAGQLLTKIIESIGLTRNQVFIANVLKCRPPGNRTPRPDEILNCQPYLTRQIQLIRPKIICGLGNFAVQTLLKIGKPISHLRGRFYDYLEPMPGGEKIKVIGTFHPAYLLRNPEDKRKVWQDMKMIKRELESPGREDPDA